MPAIPKNLDWEFTPDSPDWDGNISRILAYKHLILSMVRRDFLLNFQQTVLGPAWLFVQPLLTMLVYTIVFGKLIGIKTGNSLPPLLFYYTGIVLWNFFSESFSGISRTYRDNIHIFSKVYFPRIVAPIALIITYTIRFAIQFSLLIPMIIYFMTTGQLHFTLKFSMLVLPLVVLVIAVLSFSIGLIFSVITAKYRDIANLIDLCIRLLFFATPVLYPISFIREDMRWIVNLNPLTHLFELFRSLLFSEGTIHYMTLAATIGFVGFCLFISVYIFNKFSTRLIDII